MIISHKLDLDFANRSVEPRITVSQDDKLSRKLVLALKANGVPVSLPEGCQVLVRYRKPDGTAGSYDTLPDGTAAWVWDGDTLTVALAEQVCTVPGTVKLVITVVSGAMELNSFSITLEVLPIPKQIAPSKDYINITGFIPQSKLVQEGQYLCVSKVAEDGTIAVVDSKDPPLSAYEYALAGGFGGSEAEFTVKIAAQIDPNLENTGAVAEAKATGDAIAACNQEIRLQKTRIDNLAQLPAGSTTGDAELLDIRIGYDGTNHSSAGDAVRAQAEEIYRTMGATVLTVPGWVGNHYIHSETGNPTANNLYSYTDYMPVNHFATIDVFTQTNTTAFAIGLGFYDVSKTLISTYKSETGFAIDSPVSIPVPQRAVYVRISCRTANKPDFKVLGRDFISPLGIPEEYTYITTTWTAGSYINKNNGNTASLSVYSCSDYILVSPGDRVYVSVYAASDVSGYAFYDRNKNFLSGGTVCTDTARRWQSGLLTAPENAEYFRITNAHSGGEPKIAVIPAEKSYHALLCDSKAHKAHLDALSAKQTAMESPNYAYALDKILCIGDSLTAGAYYAGGWNGSSIRQNYPQALYRMLRSTSVTNAGTSGYSASDWYTKRISTFNYADYDSCIIWLGSNFGLTDTLAEDVEAYDSYADYATTQTGYYCKIIETILEQNPGIFLVLCTVYSSKSDVAETNRVIAKIAEKYGALLIDMSDLTIANYPELHAGVSNIHLGKAGNIFVAHRICSALRDYFAQDPLKCEFGMSNRSS